MSPVKLYTKLDDYMHDLRLINARADRWDSMLGGVSQNPNWGASPSVPRWLYHIQLKMAPNAGEVATRALSEVCMPVFPRVAFLCVRVHVHVHVRVRVRACVWLNEYACDDR